MGTDDITGVSRENCVINPEETGRANEGLRTTEPAQNSTSLHQGTNANQLLLVFVLLMIDL